MKKIIGLAVVVPLLFGGLAACGGSDSGTTTETTAAATPAQTAEATTDATEGTTEGTSAVDDYCQKVEAFAAEAKDLLQNPTSGNAADLQAKAQELQDAGAKLTQELADDPSKAEQVQQCTQKIQQALAG